MIEERFIEKFGVNFEEFAEMYFEKYGEKPIIGDVIRNNTSYTGFSIVSDECSVSPNINLDLFVALPNVSKLMDKVHDVYQHALKNVPICNINEISSAEYIKDNVFFRMVGSDNNHYLDDTISLPVTDGLALVCSVRVSAGGEGLTSYKLTSENLKNLGLDENEVLTCAMKNTPDFFPVDFDFLIPGFYYLTNSYNINGATTICYPGQMLDVLERLNCDSVYIIPASIHECFILEDDKSEDTVKKLRTHIREVNTFNVKNDEILSYNLYRYDRKRGLHIA